MAGQFLGGKCSLEEELLRKCNQISRVEALFSRYFALHPSKEGSYQRSYHRSEYPYIYTAGMDFEAILVKEETDQKDKAEKDKIIGIVREALAEGQKNENRSA